MYMLTKGNQNGFPAFLLAETQTSGASYAARRRTGVFLVLLPRERVARLPHRAPERRLTLTPIAIRIGGATMGRAWRTAVAVLQYFAGFALTSWAVSFILLATMPLLELALDKIPSATRDVCAGALLSIIAWLYVKEATAYAIMVACTVGIGWLLVSLAAVLSISLWNGVVVFVFICIVGASILYYMTPNGAKLKAAARDRIVASLIKSAPLLQKVLQAIENFQFTRCPPPKERFQSMKDVRKGLVVEHDCGPGWTCYLCRVVRKGPAWLGF